MNLSVIKDLICSLLVNACTVCASPNTLKNFLLLSANLPVISFKSVVTLVYCIPIIAPIKSANIFLPMPWSLQNINAVLGNSPGL